MSNFTRKILTFVLSIALLGCILLTGCVRYSNKNPEVTFTLNDSLSSGIGGTIKIELWPDKAPNSVNYFISLVNNEYYSKVHAIQVMSDHMVVFGEMIFVENDSVIEGEFEENGYMGNDVTFKRGTVGYMYYDGYDECFGDFFILLDDTSSEALDGKYCAIGEVTQGLEIVDQISHISTTSSLNYQPIKSVAFKSASVNLKGEKYNAPILLDRPNYTKPGTWVD